MPPGALSAPKAYTVAIRAIRTENTVSFLAQGMILWYFILFLSSCIDCLMLRTRRWAAERLSR